MNKQLEKQLDSYMFEILAELNVPHTDDILCDYMQDQERVQEAFDAMICRISRHFKREYDVETMEDVLKETDMKLKKLKEIK